MISSQYTYRNGPKPCNFSGHKLFREGVMGISDTKARELSAKRRVGDCFEGASWLSKIAYILSSPLLVPTANKFSSGSWAIAEGFGGNPCSTACKKRIVFITSTCLSSNILFKAARKAPKPNLVEEKQILAELVLQMTWAPVPCPWEKLKHC